ncbi:MAG TPA: M28 family peptidase, partial [Planctomycetota bacterium]|nr:M28 family peptidase [Planctomycetota bacterium]
WFTNEENGLRGAKAFFEAHRDRVKDCVGAYENDGGLEPPAGVDWSFAPSERRGASRPAAGADSRPAVDPTRVARARAITALLEPLGAGAFGEGGGGADIGAFLAAGVPTLSPRTRGGRYFEWHHTEGDTVDKIDRDAFARHVAAQAALFYVLADLRERL